MTSPPVGAGPERLSDPDELVPPLTIVGNTVSELRTGALTTRFAVLENVPRLTLMIDDLSVVTGIVLTVNVPEDWPAGITIEPGTEAIADRPLEILIVLPPDAAGPFKFTVPVDPVPPVTLDGFRTNDEIISG